MACRWGQSMNAKPRSDGAERQAWRGRGMRACAIRAMIGLVRFFSFFSTRRKRLVRSIIVVTFAGPYFCRNSTRSHSQWPNSFRCATTSGWNKMLSSGAKLRLRSRQPRRLRRPEGRGRQSSPGGLLGSRCGDRASRGRPDALRARIASARRSAPASSRIAGIDRPDRASRDNAPACASDVHHTDPAPRCTSSRRASGFPCRGNGWRGRGRSAPAVSLTRPAPHWMMSRHPALELACHGIRISGIYA